MSVTDPFDTVREWREQFIAVTDPLDLWLCIDGNYARPATKQETDIIAALASIEAENERLKEEKQHLTMMLDRLQPISDAVLGAENERLKRVETAFDSLTANYEDERARAEAAEEYAKEGWAWVDTALEALGAKSVFDIRDKNLSLPAAEQRVAELEEALREKQRLVDRAAELLQNSTPPRDEGWHDRFDDWLRDARAARATSEQARTPAEDAQARTGSVI